MTKDLAKWNQLIKKQDEIYHKIAKESSLADAGFWILYSLCDAEEEMCQNGFCETWSYSKQTVSAAVASLEKEGLITLSFLEGSKKQKAIHLTEKGEKFCDEKIRSLKKKEEKVLNCLTAEEKSIFFKSFDLLLENLEKEVL